MNVWTYRSIIKLPNIWRRKVKNNFQVPTAALRVSHSHFLKENLLQRGPSVESWCFVLAFSSRPHSFWAVSSQWQSIMGIQGLTICVILAPLSWAMFALKLLAGWLRLSQRCTAVWTSVFLSNPASFPSFYKCETSITVRSLSLFLPFLSFFPHRNHFQ